MYTVGNPNECNSTLTSGTKNVYPYPYTDVNEQGHRLRIILARRRRRYIWTAWVSLINCFHQGPEDGQTPGELKKCEFTLSDSPSKGEKLWSNFPPWEQRIAFNVQ